MSVFMYIYIYIYIYLIIGIMISSAYVCIYIYICLHEQDMVDKLRKPNVDQGPEQMRKTNQSTTTLINSYK